MTDVIRLRYTGHHALVFTEFGIEVSGDSSEFEVPADQAERFARRGDIEFAARGMKAKAAKAESEAGPKAEAATD